MARRVKEPEVETPLLPSFPTENWTVVVALDDGGSETLKVQARGPAAAIRTAMYTIERWPNEKIIKLVTVAPIKG